MHLIPTRRGRLKQRLHILEAVKLYHEKKSLEVERAYAPFVVSLNTSTRSHKAHTPATAHSLLVPHPSHPRSTSSSNAQVKRRHLTLQEPTVDALKVDTLGL